MGGFRWGSTAVLLGVAWTACLPPDAAVRLTRVGPVRDERPQGCELSRHPLSPPPFQVQRIASIELDCDQHGDASTTLRRCQGTLEDYACRTGADTVLNVRKHARAGGIRLVADLAINLDQPSTACVPGCSPGFECRSGSCRAVCDPACEAGFSCVSGQCMPMCNPPCPGDQLCNAERACEPRPAPAVAVPESPQAPAPAASGTPSSEPGAAPTGKPANKKKDKKRRRKRDKPKPAKPGSKKADAKPKGKPAGAAKPKPAAAK